MFKSSRSVLNFAKMFDLVLRDFVWKFSEISSESFNFLNKTKKITKFSSFFRKF